MGNESASVRHKSGFAHSQFIFPFSGNSTIQTVLKFHKHLTTQKLIFLRKGNYICLYFFKNCACTLTPLVFPDQYMLIITYMETFMLTQIQLARALGELHKGQNLFLHKKIVFLGILFRCLFMWKYYILHTLTTCTLSWVTPTF